VAKIVAQTGAAVTGFFNFFKKEERHERVIVDIGVLRFPDLTNPFIRVSTTYNLPHFDLFDYFNFIYLSIYLYLLEKFLTSITPVISHPNQGLVSMRSRLGDPARQKWNHWRYVINSLTCAFNDLCPH